MSQYYHYRAPPFFFSARQVNEQIIPQGTGTAIGDMTERGGLAGAFDSTSNQSFSGCAARSIALQASPHYVGKNYASPGKALTKAIVHGSNDLGYGHTGTPSITLTLRGKNGAPADATDGTSLGSINFTESNNESAGRTINSSDQTTRYTHVWIQIASAASNDHFIAEVFFYENTSAP